MAKRMSHLLRALGGIRSRKIPASARCPICHNRGLANPCTHIVLGAGTRSYACQPHAEQARQLGYEVFEGAPQKEDDR